MPDSRRVFFLLVLLGLALGVAACDGGKDTSQTQLDQEQSSLPLPGATQGRLLTQTPAPGTTLVANASPPPTVTSYPTPGEDFATGPFPAYILPGSWLNQSFTDGTGATRTLSDFQGRVVVVHLLSALCQPCAGQQNQIMGAIAQLYEDGELGDAVFLALSVVPDDTPTLVTNVLRTQLEKRAEASQQEGADISQFEYGWSVVDSLAQEDNPAEWLVGVAGQGLLNMLSEGLGDYALDPDTLTIMVIQPDGLGHVTTGGLVDHTKLVEAIRFYGAGQTGE